VIRADIKWALEVEVIITALAVITTNYCLPPTTAEPMKYSGLVEAEDPVVHRLSQPRG